MNPHFSSTSVDSVLPYGWRGKLGLIYIASAWSMDAEYAEMAPPGVTAHTTRIALSDDPTCFDVEDLLALEPKALEATRLLAQAPLASIAFGCTSGSFSGGQGYDQKLIQKMQAQSGGIPCTTTATSVVLALQALNVHKIAIATPYTQRVNALEEAFFNANGFQVTRITGLGLDSDYAISETSTATVYAMAKAVDSAEAEAVFISCTGLSTVRLIAALEADLQKPVVSSNQATFWQSLRLAGIRHALPNYGSLFAL